MRLSSKLAVAFSFPIALATDCSENNCLRALQNTSTRPALADCNSFLQKTVTPSAVTVTATATVTKSFVETIAPIESATKTEYFTETDTVSRTTIAFETYVVSQTTVTGTETVTSVEYLINIAKRQQTSVPTAIPAYASPCSGAVKYSSACSCIGATRTTITAATPTSTVTVTATQSSTVKETASTLMTVWATKSFTDSKTITTVETSTQGTSTTTTINAIQTDTALVHYELQTQSASFGRSLSTLLEAELSAHGLRAPSTRVCSIASKMARNAWLSMKNFPRFDSAQGI
ncbi:hypothetical protein DL95DRAFT_486003 [Leptodontidium sp. 2 PMI_412]|nr:hypothetical protein DL95DRAFT_486003 [Leptodontidium sp. 2 PMI_412]